MELKSLNCPNCGGVVQIPEGKERFFCTFCGSQIQVDDGKITIDLNANIKLDHRYTDVAKMRELDLIEQDRKQKNEEKRLENKKKKIWLLILLISIAAYASCVVIGLNFDNSFGNGAKLVGIIIAIASPITLKILFPKDWQKKADKQEKKGCTESLIKAFLVFMLLMLYCITFIMPLSF